LQWSSIQVGDLLLGYREVDRSVDAFAGPEPNLSASFRGLLVLTGIAAIVISFPVAFGILVFLGGGHGSPFAATSLAGWLMIFAFLAIPLLVLAFGVVAMRTTTRRQIGRLAAIAVAILGAFLLAHALQILAYRSQDYSL
jgi:hypothetical protein